jgi:hypothetical protein
MATKTSSNRARLKQELDKFLDEPSTRPEDADQLSKYLEARPKTAATRTILPIEEVEERLQIVRQMERRFGEISAMNLSIIMALPLETIRTRPLKTIPLILIEKLVRTCTFTDFLSTKRP